MREWCQFHASGCGSNHVWRRSILGLRSIYGSTMIRSSSIHPNRCVRDHPVELISRMPASIVQRSSLTGFRDWVELQVGLKPVFSGCAFQNFIWTSMDGLDMVKNINLTNMHFFTCSSHLSREWDNGKRGEKHWCSESNPPCEGFGLRPCYE